MKILNVYTFLKKSSVIQKKKIGKHCQYVLKDFSSGWTGSDQKRNSEKFHKIRTKNFVKCNLSLINNLPKSGCRKTLCGAKKRHWSALGNNHWTRVDNSKFWGSRWNWFWFRKISKKFLFFVYGKKQKSSAIQEGRKFVKSIQVEHKFVERTKFEGFCL